MMRSNKKAPVVLFFISIFVFALALAACGGGGDEAFPEEEAAAVEAGKAVFDVLCFACHGPDGKGVEGLGKDLTQSDFVRSNSDQELVDFIKEGRPSTHPDNTTGVDMPPSGGNPNLTDEEMFGVVAYLRSLQE